MGETGAVEQNRQLLWLVAIALSIGLHVLVVVALVATSGGDGGRGDAPRPEIVNGRDARSPSGLRDTNLASGGGENAAQTVGTGVPPVQKEDIATGGEAYYIVKSGDNLSKIAKLDGSTLAELAEMNGKTVKELEKLQVGQKLKVKNGIE